MIRSVNLVLLCFLSFLQVAHTQSLELQTISFAGSHLSHPGNITLSTTAGEVATEYLQNGGFVLSQGFEQTFQFTTSFDQETQTLFISIYPNPTAGDLNFSSGMEVLPSHLYVLNAKGELLMAKPFTDLKQTISVSHLPGGSYFIHLAGQGRSMGVWKIQKI